MKLKIDTADEVEYGSDSLQLYRELMSELWRILPKSVYGDMRRVMVLAWAVIGLLLTKSVNQAEWGEVVHSSATQASSHQRRFSNFFDNPWVRVPQWYGPIFRETIQDWELGSVLYVGLDTSDLGNGFILIRASLIYRGRSVPVAWDVIKHNSTSVRFKQYRRVLEQARRLLPKHSQVILLADRGFLHRKLVAWCRRRRWHYRLRAKRSTVVRLPDGRRMSMERLCPEPGHACAYHNVTILGEQLGTVHIALGNSTNPDEDPWFVVSDQPTSLDTLDEYGLRFDMEEEFLDNKSNGFQVEDSKLDKASALERLFLVIAIATLHCVSVGVQVVNQNKRRWVDTHWDRGLSYFKIGWRWIRQQFRKKWPTMIPFWLDPRPDPEPATASRAKDQRDANDSPFIFDSS